MSDAAAVVEQEEIRQQIDESRNALVEKLELLEEKVAETVQNATDTMAEATATVLNTVNNATASVTDVVENVNTAVQGTVDSVRHTVSDTVESVRTTFDLPEQFQRHPWPMFAGAVVLGYLGGNYFGQSVDKSGMNHRPERTWTPNPPVENRVAGQMNSPYSPTVSSPESYGDRAEQASISPKLAVQSSKHLLHDLFGNELTKLKGLAIGVSMGLLRDMISESVPPSFRPQLTEVIDGFTEKLGGEQIRGPILPESSSSAAT